MQGGVECLYELNLLHHVGVVAKGMCAAAHEGDDNTPSGPPVLKFLRSQKKRDA